MELHDARVLITGASRGIGRALALGFAARGADLVLIARTTEALEGLPGSHHAVDLSEPGATDGLIDRLGPVDVLVNNAGISAVKFVLEHSDADFERILRVNLLAPMGLSRDAARAMLERGRGHIVNMSSMGAVLVPPGLSGYVASKGGLSAFTAALRHELRDLPVGITLVELGSVTTDMDEKSRTYGPIKALAEKSGGRDIVPMETVVAAIVRAVEENKPHVRLPKQLALLPALVEAPRRITRFMFRKQDVRAPGVD